MHMPASWIQRGDRTPENVGSGASPEQNSLPTDNANEINSLRQCAIAKLVWIPCVDRTRKYAGAATAPGLAATMKIRLAVDSELHHTFPRNDKKIIFCDPNQPKS